METPNFEEMKKEELVAFLKKYPAKTSGNKPILIQRAKDYFATKGPPIEKEECDTVNSDPEILQNLEKKRKIFTNDKLKWLDIASFPKGTIPKIEDEVIATFFTNCEFQFGEEIIESGTKKPTTKGRDMYLSPKIQLCEFAKSKNTVLFRCTIGASMKQEFRYPQVSFSGGKFVATKCTCVQRNGGRCSHIAALMYLIQEVSFGATPRLEIASTSKPQYWGHGTKTEKNPQPVQFANYSKRIKCDKYVNFDPRPANLRSTSIEEINSFVRDNQISSMNHGFMSNWDSVFKITYDDYEITDERREIIQVLKMQWLTNMLENLESYDNDRLSNLSSFHITGTEDQSMSEQWFNERNYRVTASVFHDFAKNSVSFLRRFWESKTVPETAAITYGKVHEKDAIEAFENKFNCSVTKCGLFVSKT